MKMKGIMVIKGLLLTYHADYGKIFLKTLLLDEPRRQPSLLHILNIIYIFDFYIFYILQIYIF